MRSSADCDDNDRPLHVWPKFRCFGGPRVLIGWSCPCAASPCRWEFFSVSFPPSPSSTLCSTDTRKPNRHRYFPIPVSRASRSRLKQAWSSVSSAIFHSPPWAGVGCLCSGTCAFPTTESASRPRQVTPEEETPAQRSPSSDIPAATNGHATAPSPKPAEIGTEAVPESGAGPSAAAQDKSAAGETEGPG